MKSIPLTQGKFAVVDDEDFDRLTAMGKWCAARRKRKGFPDVFYAVRNGPRSEKPRKTILMHHVVIGLPSGTPIDHANHDGLDNRKENIRRATPMQNMHNKRSSKTDNLPRGVRWVPGRQTYHAIIKVDGKSKFLGRFEDPLLAAAAYDAASLEHHGEYGIRNNI